MGSYFAGEFPDFYKERPNIFAEEMPKLFTGHLYDLERFWNVLFINRFECRNVALLSHRKMGKTSFLLRLCNIMFAEQDEVAPIFYTFPQDEGMGEKKTLKLQDVADDMAITFIKQLAAFVCKRPDWLKLSEDHFIREVEKINHPNNIAQEILESLAIYHKEQKKYTSFYKICGVFRILVSLLALLKKRCFMVIDEAQEMDASVYDETGDLITCSPALFEVNQMTNQLMLALSGSQVSMLHYNILAPAMRNRISPQTFFPLDENESEELVAKFLERHGYSGYPGLGKDVHLLTGGQPFYIQLLFDRFDSRYVRQKGKPKTFGSVQELQEVFDFEAKDTAGLIFKYWDAHFERNASKLNCDGDQPGLTARILYYIAQRNSKQLRNSNPPESPDIVNFEDIMHDLNLTMDVVMEKAKQLRDADFLYADMQATRVNYISDRVLPLFLLEKYYKKILVDKPTIANKNSEQAKYMELVALSDKVATIAKKQAVQEKKIGAVRQAINSHDKRIRRQDRDLSVIKGSKLEEEVAQAIHKGHAMFKEYQGCELMKIHIPQPGSKGEVYEIDLFAAARKVGRKTIPALAMEVKNLKGKVYIAEAERFVAKISALKTAHKLRKVAACFVSRRSMSKNAAALLSQNGVQVVTAEELGIA
jgi:hypothetical protein